MQTAKMSRFTVITAPVKLPYLMLGHGCGLAKIATNQPILRLRNWTKITILFLARTMKSKHPY